MEIINRVLLEDKIYEMFEEALNHMEEKFNNDYDELRNLSIIYTEMYHDINDNITPQIISLEENSVSINSIITNEISLKDNYTTYNDRSKTPVKNIGVNSKPYVIKPSKNEEFKLVNKKENESTPVKTERSKTPGIQKNKNNSIIINSNSNKLENNNKIIGSINSVTIKDRNQDDSILGIKKVDEQVDSSFFVSKDVIKNTKGVKEVNIKQNNNKDKINSQVQEIQQPIQLEQKVRNTKQPKAIFNKNEGKARDLTPVVNNKKLKNMLDISADDIKNESKTKEYISNIANTKNVNNLRNNQKQITLNNQKSDNLKKIKRNTGIDILPITNIQSKRSKADTKNYLTTNIDCSAKRNESDENNKENNLNEFTKVEIKLIKEIEVPMKKKEFTFSSNSLECLFIFVNSE